MRTTVWTICTVLPLLTGCAQGPGAYNYVPPTPRYATESSGAYDYARRDLSIRHHSDGNPAGGF